MSNTNKTQALFVKAAKRLQQGDALGAKQGLLKVVKQVPESAVAWYNLGLSHQHLGEHEKAIAVYNKVVKIKPDFVDGWVNLAMSYQTVGDIQQAQAAATRGASLDPNHPRTTNLLGTLAAESGDQEIARDFFEKTLRSAPDFDDARFNLATLHYKMGQDQKALTVGEPLFKTQSDDKQYLLLHARILLGMGRNEDASDIVERLQERYPDDEAVLRLALIFRQAIRDYFGLLDVTEQLLRHSPNDADLWNSQGVAYFHLDSIEKAKSCYEKAIVLDPERAGFESNLGLAFSSLGNKDSAEQHYRQSLQLDPEYAETYRNFAMMKHFSSIDDPDAQKIKALWERDDLDDSSVIHLSFALGKIYDDCGEFSMAFEAYKRGNDLKFKESGIDLDQYFSHMDRIAKVFDRPPKEVVITQTDPSPIFILGMPRSGTTLVEQIISRHPSVFGCGELPCIERAITRLEKTVEPMRVYPDDFWDISAEDMNREVLQYRDWVNRLHDIKTPNITDKMPFNFVHIWLIKSMFPDAPVVHCQRHPLDTILSNYFQFYASDINYVYNLEALATYYVHYHRLMEHWFQIFGEALTQIAYEDLILDSDRETKKLIEAIGLPWDDSCLDPKRSDTAVRTASIWQVRQGIYTRSKERWRNYERQLTPAIEILKQENILNEDLGYAR